MKNTKRIYWITTGLVAFLMLYSAFAYITQPAMAGAFKHLGFPSYFRIELAVGKALGALALIIPAVPTRIKEWAYAGFGITLVSAIIAHIMSGDPASVWIAPVVFLLLLITSYVYFHRAQETQPQSLTPAY